MTTTSVYRCFDSEGVLLYVGLSRDVSTRMKAHRSISRWFWLAKTIQETVYSCANEAAEQEQLAILTEKPLFNKSTLRYARHKPSSRSPEMADEVERFVKVLPLVNIKSSHPTRWLARTVLIRAKYGTLRNYADLCEVNYQTMMGVNCGAVKGPIAKKIMDMMKRDGVMVEEDMRGEK